MLRYLSMAILEILSSRACMLGEEEGREASLCHLWDNRCLEASLLKMNVGTIAPTRGRITRPRQARVHHIIHRHHVGHFTILKFGYSKILAGCDRDVGIVDSAGYSAAALGGETNDT